MKNSDDTLLLEIGELLVKAMDNALSREEFDRLQKLLKDDPLAREYYYDILATFAGVDEIGIPSTEEGAIDLLAWKALADIERTAPAVTIEKTERKPETVAQTAKAEKIVRKVNKVSLMVAIASLAALFFLIVFAHYLPVITREEVATLADSMNAEWTEADISGNKNIRLAVREGPLTLKKGVAKLRFDSNVRVVIEAPSKFELITGDQIQLYCGRVYAVVPPEAVGFAVKTFNSKIVDLGTEFGVQADGNGTTELHVIKGKATLVSGNQNKASMVLTEGIAKKISGLEARLLDIQCDKERFAREISSKNQIIWRGESIRLADMVSGGNGLGTGTPNVGINPISGQTQEIKEVDRIAPNSYVTSPKNKNLLIDGVFVPNGATKQIVSSQGDVFEECPVTHGNFFTEIANTPQIVVLSPAVMNGGNGADRHSCLFIHANLGITFDLNAIRSQIAGIKVKRFESKLCISQTAPRQPNGDFWVLVDGKVRYSKKNVSQKESVDSVTIDLQENDRFLTLAATDGGDPETRTLPDGFVIKSIDSDWCVFAKPVLILE
jgi:hypothetical protein